MDGIAQVVQQLANELSLILLLNPTENRGIRRRRAGGRKGRFQIPSPCRSKAGTNAAAGEFPDSLKKLPRVGRPKEAATISRMTRVPGQYMLYCVAISGCLCSRRCPSGMRPRIPALTTD
jgi:hypothetical protein